MGTDHDNPAASSPWRQPIVWLVVALLVAAVASGVVMVLIAGGAGNNDAVPDQVQRTGGAQVANLDADELARARGLSAIVRVDAKAGMVEVLPVSGDFDRKQSLRLSLHHPVRADEDQVLALVASATGWQVAARIDDDHDWNLQLEPQTAALETAALEPGAPDAGAWRLRGRLPKGQQAARVAPALQVP